MTRAPFEALAQALGDDLCHPVRIRLLALYALDDVADERLSPSEATAALGDYSLGTVAYHVRAMVKAGLLVKAGRDGQVRGAIVHYYRLSESGRRRYASLGARLVAEWPPDDAPEARRARGLEPIRPAKRRPRAST